MPGRPYELRPGDEVLIRRTIPHPERREQQLRNGTPVTVTHVHGNERLVLRLGDRDDVELDRNTAAKADLRLAYVQHPFPAQGVTTDTAHLIVAEHATQEGTYVALTRARERTDIHAASAASENGEPGDRLPALAERIGRTEPELPSIRVPLAHEHAITNHPDIEMAPHEPPTPDHAPKPTPGSDQREPEPVIPTSSRPTIRETSAFDIRTLAADDPGRRLPNPPDRAADDRAEVPRRWPRRTDPDPEPEHDRDLYRSSGHSW